MSDASLYLRWLSGDRSAGAELLDRHEAELMRWLERQVGVDAALDVSQTTWLEARRLGSYRGEGSFAGWLRRVASTVLRDERRREAGRCRVLGEWEPRDGTSPSRALLRAEAAAALEDISHEAIRETAREHWLRGREPAEIAETQGVPIKTIRSRLRLATERLREQLL